MNYHNSELPQSKRDDQWRTFFQGILMKIKRIHKPQRREDAKEATRIQKPGARMVKAYNSLGDKSIKYKSIQEAESRTGSIIILASGF